MADDTVRSAAQNRILPRGEAGDRHRIFERQIHQHIQQGGVRDRSEARFTTSRMLDAINQHQRVSTLAGHHRTALNESPLGIDLVRSHREPRDALAHEREFTLHFYIKRRIWTEGTACLSSDALVVRAARNPLKRSDFARVRCCASEWSWRARSSTYAAIKRSSKKRSNSDWNRCGLSARDSRRPRMSYALTSGRTPRLQTTPTPADRIPVMRARPSPQSAHERVARPVSGSGWVSEAIFVILTSRRKPPADGRGLPRDTCRDSCVTHVATHHTVEARGFEPLTLALQRRCSTN